LVEFEWTMALALKQPVILLPARQYALTSFTR
jgi:hypothetical protein